MTQELTTTRDVPGAIKTTTPGMASAGYGDLFTALIRQKMAQQAYQRAQAQAPAPQMAQPAYRESAPQRAPTMGTSQSAQESDDPNKRKYLTRTVQDPYASPYDGMQGVGWGMQKIGGPKMVTERFIPGEGWEFDKVDPRRAGSGGRGSIDTGDGNHEVTSPTSNLQAKMPAYNTGSPQSGMDYAPLTGLPRYKTEAPVAPARTGGYFKATKGKN